MKNKFTSVALAAIILTYSLFSLGGVVASAECGSAAAEQNTDGGIRVSSRFFELIFGGRDEKKAPLYLVPGGTVFGAKIKQSGVVVTEIGTGSSQFCIGDRIIRIGGEDVKSLDDAKSKINSSGGASLDIELLRGGERRHISVTPSLTGGSYKLGVVLKDGAAGIGTITYITSNGKFGALGHGITDVDTGLLMQIDGGKLFDAEVLSVVKGKNGIPGELIGIIRQSGMSQIGEIDENCSKGIYGQVKLGMVDNSKAIPIALKQDIKLGPATIYCQVDSEVREYEIEIERIELGRTNDNKGLVIKITDEALLKKTGGIVQGMSGSPIIQDGKVVGAVTHVLVNDPTRGYGIFIENMLEAAE